MLQETTEDELEPEDLEGEDAENYTVGIRAMATVTKGHSKLIFSLVCTNGIWIEKVGAWGRTSPTNQGSRLTLSRTRGCSTHTTSAETDRRRSREGAGRVEEVTVGGGGGCACRWRSTARTVTWRT